MGPQDIEQVGLFVNKRFPIPQLARLQHGHLSLEQVRPYLQPQAWEACFKFAFVRNPFDRLHLLLRVRDSRRRRDSIAIPSAVMREIMRNPPNEHLLFQPQHTFVTDAAGALLSDDVGRVEEKCRNPMTQICSRIGIPTAALEKVNASKRNGISRILQSGTDRRGGEALRP